MTTGDEPQLGGLPEDNAPMISGRGTKIIVSARGAYLAGNLEALTELMPSVESLMFKHTLIKHAFEIVHPVIERIPENERYAGLITGVEIVQRWLLNPLGSHVEDLSQILRDTHLYHYDFTGDNPNGALFFLCHALRDDEPSRSIRLALRAACKLSFRRFTLAHTFFIREQLERWNIDLAWAILQHQNSPSPPFLDEQTLHTCLSDSIKRYEEHNLAALLYNMNSNQRREFERIVFEQAFTAIQQAADEHPHREELLDVLERIHRHFYAQDEFRLQDIRWPNPGEKGPLRLWRAIYRLVYDDWRIVDDEVADAFITSRQAAHALAVLDEQPEHAFNRPYPISRNRGQDWHLEIAYAILTNQPIPPLGELNDER